MLEPGVYLATITGHTVSINQKKNPTIRFNIDVTSSFAENEIDEIVLPQPLKKAIHLVLTQGTVGTAGNPGFVCGTLRHLNFDSDDFADLPDHDFTGQVHRVLLKMEEYRDKPVERWSFLTGHRNTPLQDASILSAYNAPLAATPKRERPQTTTHVAPPTPF
jgi:hypothetical protein